MDDLSEEDETFEENENGSNEESEEEEVNYSHDSDESYSEEDDYDYLCAAMKRKHADEEQNAEANKGKRIHKSLRDDPRPIATPALRKKKEKELAENPSQKNTPKQLHPSIIAQPLINKEKEKEKELRDKERASTSNPNIETVETVEIDDSDPIILDSEENKNTNNTLTKLVNEKIKVDKPPGTSKQRTPRRLQMIANQEPYDVLKDLNSLKCNISILIFFTIKYDRI